MLLLLVRLFHDCLFYPLLQGGERGRGRGEVLCVGTRSHFSLGSLWKGVGLALGVHVQKGVWFKGKWFNCFLLASPTLVEQFHASEPIKIQKRHSQ